MSHAMESIILGNLSDLNGTRIAGTIPISETLINTAANEAINKRHTPIRAVDIQIGTDNHLEMGVNVALGPFTKWLRPEVIIDRQSTSAIIVLTIASAGYAGMLRIVELLAQNVLPGGIVIRGRQIVFDLAVIARKPEYRSIVQRVRSLTIETTPGKLFLNFELEIK